MSKTEAKPAEVKQEVAVQAAAQVPAELGDLNLQELEGDAGAGSQNITSTDIATPILSVLQANSPQCKRSDGKYIQGAAEGMIFNNVTNEVYDGDKGITVIPCYFEKVFIEWAPNRGGLVAIHDAQTELRNQVQLLDNGEGNGRTVPTLPNGNHLIETNQHYVLLVHESGFTEPAVIAMSSSALRSSRQWNSLMKKIQVAGAGGKPFNPASYYAKYLLKTIARQKDSFSWFSWAVENAGVVNAAQYASGKAFEKMVAEGTVKVKQDEMPDVTAPASSGKDEEIPY